MITVFVISKDNASTKIANQMHWEDENGFSSFAFLPHCPWTCINSWILKKGVCFLMASKSISSRFGPASSLVPYSLAVLPGALWSFSSFICLHGCAGWYGTLPWGKLLFSLVFREKRDLIAPSANLKVFGTFLGFKLFFNYSQIRSLANTSC